MLLISNKPTTDGPAAPLRCSGTSHLVEEWVLSKKEGPTPGKYVAAASNHDDDAAANWPRDRLLRAWRVTKQRIAALEFEAATMRDEVRELRANSAAQLHRW